MGRASVLATLLIAALAIAACAPKLPPLAESTAATAATATTVSAAERATPAAAAPTIIPAATATDAPTTPTGAAALSANPWQWVSFTNPAGKFDVEKPEMYLLAFRSDGTQTGGLVNIKAGCNNAGGTYTTDDKSLAITLGPTTTAACPPESRSDQFLKLLPGAAKYFFQDDKLYIDLYADGGTLAFAPASSSSR